MVCPTLKCLFGLCSAFICRRVGRGRATTVAVFMHEARRISMRVLAILSALIEYITHCRICLLTATPQVPHNIADFALLVGQGMPTLNALKLQFITAFGSIISPYLFSTDDRF